LNLAPARQASIWDGPSGRTESKGANTAGIPPDAITNTSDLRAAEASQGNREQSIEPDKARQRILAFEHAQLLMQDSKLKPKTMARAKGYTEPIRKTKTSRLIQPV